MSDILPVRLQDFLYSWKSELRKQQINRKQRPAPLLICAEATSHKDELAHLYGDCRDPA